MIIAMLILLAAGASKVDPGTVLPDGNRIQWMALPSAEKLMRCVKHNPPPQAQVVLECRSTATDELRDCQVISKSANVDAAYEAAAMCASQFFRVRATDPNGNTIEGETVRVPVQIRLP